MRPPFSDLRHHAQRAALAVSLGLALTSCDNPQQGEFRYRLTFSVEVDGVVQTGSSIIGVRYWGGTGGMTTSAVTAFSDWRGIAPVIKIGRRGWLIAAMFNNNARFERLKGPHAPTCPELASAADFPAVFRKPPAELAKMTEGEAQVPPDLYPSFIWMRAHTTYLDAVPVCPDDFSRVVGQQVELKSVSVEVANDAPLVTLQPFEAPWLKEIRAEQGQTQTSGSDFKIYRQRQIETETIKTKSGKF